jgi:hypothetical protein
MKRISIFTGMIFLILLMVELGYRILNPYPYFSDDEINATQHGNLSEYDPLLGWKGVPRGKERFITRNNSVIIENNRFGFRDIEHDTSSGKPAIVFLGDSFGWGFEVEFDEIFVNILREKLRDYEIFNLSHRGYGNDQELLTFENWEYNGPLKYVVLIFTDDDVANNYSSNEYEKPKPKFEIVGDELILTGVPVPKIQKWDNGKETAQVKDGWRKLKDDIKKFLFKSHFLHAMYRRWLYFKFEYLAPDNPEKNSKVESPGLNETENQEALALTTRIILELEMKVEEMGGKLIVVFAPSGMKAKFSDGSVNYQDWIIVVFERMGITCLDLQPYIQNTWRRAYYRHDGHWNPHGHRIAVGSIYNYLINIAELRTGLESNIHE